MRLDPTVKKETLYIAAWTAVLSLVMHAVFLALGAWNLSVLWGNLLSLAAGILNFLLLGLTVQKAVGMTEAKEAKTFLRLSQLLRTLGLFGVAALGALVPVFNVWATLIPLFFPRIAILFRPLFFKKDAPPAPEATGEEETDA